MHMLYTQKTLDTVGEIEVKADGVEMLIHGVPPFLWLLLLLHVSGSDSMKFSLFDKKPYEDSTTVPPVQDGEGEVSLVGPQTTSQGRVEVYHDGKWGAVCDGAWGLAEAQKVCRQLLVPGTKAAVNRGTYREDLNLTTSGTRHSLDHSLSLSEELGQLFDSGDGCDFQISVQSPTGNIQEEDGTTETVGTTVCAHKMILSRFPRFNAIEGISNISVYVSRSCQQHFPSFIRYIYTHKTDVSSSTAQCLHQMASDFGVKRLMEDIGRLFTKLLPEDVTFHTQLSLYEYSVETGDLLLQENTLQYLAWNYQNLSSSPAWSRLSAELLGALLSRSDLVVPDEAFLLLSLERWISEKGNSTTMEVQADLLNRIRFCMIPAEKLYHVQLTSTLYKTHHDLYRDSMLKALHFNVLLFSTLKSSTDFKREDNNYQPRIYTAEPWSAAIHSTTVRETPREQSQPTNPPRYVQQRGRKSYGQYQYGYQHQRYQYTTVSPYLQSRTKSFSTPVHNSMIFKEKIIHWEANVFMSRDECSNKGITCESFPAARLSAQSSLSQYQSSIRFSNRLLLMCRGKSICQVHDFKNNVAYISPNSSQALPCPCPDEQYIYRFVVRPDYV
ncbi:galectin-3-binding protein B-like [Diretmus argenteus]